MYWRLLAFIALTSTCYGTHSKTNSPSKTEQPPYDADLFNQDKPVFSFHTSFLYWRVQEGAVDYALKMTQTPAPNTSYAQGKYHKATFNGEPGFRVALSYFRAPRYWEIYGQYTRLTASGKNHANMPNASGRYLNGTWPDLITSDSTFLTKSTSSIHLNYNVADLLVDRYFVPNPHLRLRLLGGGTAGWINQNWTIHYFNDLNQNTQIRNQWKFIGGGFRVGSYVDWFWTSDIYFTSSVSFASLLGTYKNQSKQTVSTVNVPVRNAKFDDVRTAFSIQFIFGPSWQKSFLSTRWEVFAGYELNAWYNLQEIYRSTAAIAQSAKETLINTSALALQGLTVRLTGDF